MLICGNADGLVDAVADAQFGGIELRQRRAGRREAIEAEAQLVDHCPAERVRFVEGEDLPQRASDVAETGNRVAECGSVRSTRNRWIA